MSEPPQVSQSGHITPRHLTSWTTDGVIQDAGTPANPVITGGLGIISSNQVSIGVDNAVNTGPFNQLSFGVTASAGWIGLAAYGGAADLPLNIFASDLNFIIDGVVYPWTAAPGGFFLPLSGGTLSGPGNLTVGGTLGVTGNATFTGNSSFGGTLSVTGTSKFTVAGTSVTVGSAPQNTMTITPGATTADVTTVTPAGTASNSGFYFNGGPLQVALLQPGRGNTYNWAGSTLDILKIPFFLQSNATGSSTFGDIATCAGVQAVSVNLAAPSSLVSAVGMTMVTGGSVAASAGWSTLTVSMNDGASATNDKAAGTQAPFVPLQITRIASKNQGGTGLTPSTSFGQNWGCDIINKLASGATNIALQNGLEINMAVNTGASVVRRAAIQISSQNSHLVRGAMWDYGISGLLEAGGATLREWMTVGGGLSGTSPLGSDSSFLAIRLAQDKTAVADSALDANDATLTSFFLRSNGFQVGPTGTTRISTTYFTAVAAGLEIDAKGSVGTIAGGGGAINAGGSGYPPSTAFTADDAFGGVYTLTPDVTGAVVSAVVIRQPVFSSTSPPATLAVTPRPPYNTGTGAVLNATWTTTAIGLSLQPTAGGKIGFNGATPIVKPTGVAVTAAGIHAALTSLGLIAP